MIRNKNGFDPPRTAENFFKKSVVQRGGARHLGCQAVTPAASVHSEKLCPLFRSTRHVQGLFGLITPEQKESHSV